MTEEALFELALNIPEAARGELLERECAGNTELRGRIEALLAADATVGPAPTATAPTSPDEQGVILAGKYTLLEVVGEGGMGSVWRAKQTEPVKRHVAIKLIKAGMDSKAVLARFDAERQALAMMDHPNIAKVLDGGLTPDNRPFFVMELVKGVPITEYCDARKLTPKERLELFVQVCQAIQHAHLKGIIHRDIKPNNVLIALYDDKPVVKVIDFGVAKATGGALTEQTIDTAFGGVVGTPQYMSPEQATFNNLDIDTRSDVYALGVLLYELLAGSPPFSGAELKKKGLLEILRVVREEEPPRPSAKLSTADALPSLSANRGTEPKKLTGLLRNELDWIVMKALEKDRTRRYETANGFAADVLRYLGGEAVLAHPPSTAYRFEKFLRKNRGPVIATGLILTALLAGIAGTAVGLTRALDAERDAVQAQRAEAERADGEKQAKQRALAAVEAEKQAKTQAEKATIEERAANSIVLLGLREALREWPCLRFEETPERPCSTERLLYALVDSLDRTLPWIYDERPDIQARARRTIAYVLHDFGLEAASEGQYTAALALYRRASKEEITEDIISTMDDLADSLNLQGKFAEAEPLCRQVVESYRRTKGEEEFATRRACITFTETLVGLGRTAEAERLTRRVLEVERRVAGNDADTTLQSMEILARIHASKGEWEEAESLRVRAVEVRRRVNSAESELRLNTTEQLAIHYLHRRRPADAEPVLRECLALCEKTQPVVWSTFNTQSMLGGALLGQKKYAEAEPLLLKGYEGMKQREKSIPPQGATRLPEALDRLIELYTALEKPHEVKKWTAVKAQLPKAEPPEPSKKK